MYEKDNLWPRLSDKYSIKLSNESLQMMGFFNNISNNFE